MGPSQNVLSVNLGFSRLLIYIYINREIMDWCLLINYQCFYVYKPNQFGPIWPYLSESREFWKVGFRAIDSLAERQWLSPQISLALIHHFPLISSAFVGDTYHIYIYRHTVIIPPFNIIPWWVKSYPSYVEDMEMYIWKIQHAFVFTHLRHPSSLHARRRYVMDRYVEKDVAAAPKEGAQGTKQATTGGLGHLEGDFLIS